MVNINIDIEIPEGLYDAGAIELFAKSVGWTEQTASTDLETADELINNPISAFDYGKAHITNYLLIKTREQFQKEKTIEGETEFNSLIV